MDGHALLLRPPAQPGRSRALWCADFLPPTNRASTRWAVYSVAWRCSPPWAPATGRRRQGAFMFEHLCSIGAPRAAEVLHDPENPG
jgi:hypothetical protein